MKKSSPLQVGEKFGRLTIICLDHIKTYYRTRNNKISKNNVEYYKCLCECGKEIITSKSSLKSGDSKSCGCLQKEKAKMTGFKNKKYFSQIEQELYKRYIGIRTRCYNKNRKQYKDYGGRGIKMCDEWLNKENGFYNFYTWSINNGYDKKLSLDRIDVNGNYEPSNCRWTDAKTQQRNRRNNRILEYNGEKHCLEEWGEILNKDTTTLRHRIKKNYSLDELFSKKDLKDYIWEKREKEKEQERIKTLINSYKRLLIKGKRYNNLEIIDLDHIDIIEKINYNDLYIEYYKCKCDCGEEFIAEKSDIIKGKVKSCGCVIDKIKVNSYKKDLELLSKIYQNIKTRCYNLNSPEYNNYGGRGIKMCDEWKNDFLSFFYWSVKNGFDCRYRNKYFYTSIDRIDVNGDYCPENCRWADAKTQARNRRNNHMIEYNGEAHCVSEWAEIIGVSPHMILNGIKLLNKGIDYYYKKYYGKRFHKPIIRVSCQEYKDLLKNKKHHINYNY